MRIHTYMHTWDSGWWPHLVLPSLPLRIDGSNLELQPSLQNPATTNRAAHCWACQSIIYYELYLWALSTSWNSPSIAISQVLLIGLHHTRLLYILDCHAWLTEAVLSHIPSAHLISLAGLKPLSVPSPSFLNLLYVTGHISLSLETWLQNQVQKK